MSSHQSNDYVDKTNQLECDSSSQDASLSNSTHQLSNSSINSNNIFGYSNNSTKKQSIYGCGDGFWKKQTDIITTTKFPTLDRIDYLQNYLQNDKIIKFQSQDKFCIFLTANGNVYKMGQCGFMNNMTNIPTLIKFNNLLEDKIVDFSIGKEHLVFLSKFNKIYGMGNDEFGQLNGRKSNDVVNNLLEFTNLEKLSVKKIFATFYLTFFITIENELFVCGRNDNGQTFHPTLLESNEKKVQQFYNLTNFRNITKFIFEINNLFKNNNSIENIKDIKCDGARSIIIYQDNSTIISPLFSEPGMEGYLPKLSNIYKKFKLERNYEKIIFNEYQILTLCDNECKIIDFNGNLTKMEDVTNMESGTFHSFLQTSDSKIYSFGSNECGELGFVKKSNEPKLVELPFPIKEGDKIEISCGKNFTIFIHETENEDLLDINNLIVTDNYHFNYEINSNFYLNLNLLKNISNDFYIFIKNTNLIENLNENDQKVLYYLIKNALINLNNLTDLDELFSTYDKFINLINFEELELNLVTCLFILNDINDINQEIKVLLFNDISNRINNENIFNILQKVNNFLSLNILKQSKNSVLLLLASKCLAFIKEHENLKSESFYELIKDKLQNVKKPFKQINYKLTNNGSNIKNINESLQLLYNNENNIDENSQDDVKIIIDSNLNEKLNLQKRILSIHSPVLNILFKNNLENEINLYEFIEMMISDHWIKDLFYYSKNEIREILKIIFKYCYGFKLNNFNLNTLIGILIISQQLEITWLIKYTCHLIIEKLHDINDTEFILLLNLVSISQNNNSCKEFVEYFKIFCSSNLTFDYLQKIQSTCKDNESCNNFIKVIIDYYLRTHVVIRKN